MVEMSHRLMVSFQMHSRTQRLMIRLYRRQLMMIQIMKLKIRMYLFQLC